MAVHKRAYRPYDGPLTSERTRFVVMARYALLDLFESRVLIALFVVCLLPFVVEAGLLYLANSLSAAALLGIEEAMPAVGPMFFFVVLTVQGGLATVLTAWVAPLLVAPDLVNGALPLHLSRPLTRFDYVLGKAAVLSGLLAAVTCLPGLLLFGLHAGLAGREWALANLRVAGAIVAGSAIWILVLTLLGLAISAAIRWRVLASAAVLATFCVGVAFGEVWGEVLRNPWGRLASLAYLMGLVWRDLMVPGAQPLWEPLFHTDHNLPTWAAVLALAATCLACAAVLHHRLRAREAVW